MKCHQNKILVALLSASLLIGFDIKLAQSQTITEPPDQNYEDFLPIMPDGRVAIQYIERDITYARGSMNVPIDIPPGVPTIRPAPPPSIPSVLPIFFSSDGQSWTRSGLVLNKVQESTCYEASYVMLPDDTDSAIYQLACGERYGIRWDGTKGRWDMSRLRTN